MSEDDKSRSGDKVYLCWRSRIDSRKRRVFNYLIREYFCIAKFLLLFADNRGSSKSELLNACFCKSVSLFVLKLFLTADYCSAKSKTIFVHRALAPLYY